MDFQYDFGTQNNDAQPKRVFQTTHDSSPHYRTNIRIYHPVTEKQMNTENFRDGDNLRMRITESNDDKTFMNLQVVKITTYSAAKAVLGSYNAANGFGGAPFTHVLILEA
jgi:hypothetical protein